VKNLADENDEHGDEEYTEEENQLPPIAWRHLTYPLYRRTDDVTRICVHVRYTAAVSVFLHSHNHSVIYQSINQSINQYWFFTVAQVVKTTAIGPLEKISQCPGSSVKKIQKISGKWLRKIWVFSR